MNNRLKINITGKNPDYFLKELIKRKIDIYDVEKTHNKLKLIINYEDYKKLLKIKTTYKIKIINRYGLSKYKLLLKRYSLLISLLLLGILLNIILSNIIFNVEVINPNKKLNNIIKEDLKTLGIKKYHFKVSYKKREMIKKKLLEKERDKIEWLEIEEKGTTYLIKVEERKKNKKESLCNYRHIVASKKGVILDINAESGEVVKKINDYVEKNDIIISGFIHNKETITSKRCSRGVVYAETWYKVVVTFPKNIKKEKILNNKRVGLTLKIFNKDYNFLNKYPTFKKNTYNIIEGKIIPISLGISTYQKTKIINNNYNIKEIDKYALIEAEKKIKKKLNKDEAVISKKVLKKKQNNSKIEVDVFIKLKEDITSYQDITDVDIEELNKKEE